MGRPTIRLVMKLVGVALLVFLICIFKLSISLNDVDYDTSSAVTKLYDERHSNERDCIQEVSMVKQQYQHEIEMLQDQIRELQNMIFGETANNSITARSTKMTQSCLKEINFGSKASKTDAVQGRSYPSERHIPIFNRFDMWDQYRAKSGYGEAVKHKLNGLQRMDVDEVIDEAVSFINTSGWRRDHFLEGIYQNSDTIGTHYELYFVNDKNDKERVTLFRPQAPAVALHHELVGGDDKFNIIIPLSGRMDAFLIFLVNFEKVLVKMNYRITLTIVYFGSSLKDVMSIFQGFIMKHRYRSFHIEHVTSRNFSRGYALDRGIRSWKGRADPLVFLCDVDIIFNQEFIDRCRSYPEKHARVYYPIVFSLYNPKVIEHYFDQKFGSLADKLKVSADHGFWRHFGYGMACLYRSDYLQSEGFNLDLKEWGEEDVLLFRKFAQSNLTVIRAPDPNIFHLWHHKSCDQTLSDDHYRACIKSKTHNEGSHMQLGYMVFKDELEQHRKNRHHL